MAKLKINAKDEGQLSITEGINCMGKGQAIAVKWLLALLLLWCMITETSTQPATPKLKYPIHTFLPPNATNPIDSTNPCYPDQVYIPASTYMQPPSPYLDKCIKCSQFASNMQTCELLSARLNIIVVKNKTLYRQFAGGTLDCNDENGYMVQGVHCSHKAIGARYQPGTTDDACFGDEINCYKCDSSSTTKCSFCGYGFYPDTNKKCQPIQILHCLSLKTSDINKCDLCEQGYGFLNFSPSGTSGTINNVTCNLCPSPFRDCTNSTDTSKSFTLDSALQSLDLNANKRKTIKITGAVYANLTIPQGALMTIQNTQDANFTINTQTNVPNANVLNVTCNPPTSITHSTNSKYTYFSPSANSRSTVQSKNQNIVVTLDTWYSSSVITLTLQSPQTQTITLQSILVFRTPLVEISSDPPTAAPCLMDDTHPLGPCDSSFFPCVYHPNCKYCSTRTLQNNQSIQVCQTCQNQLYLLRQKTDCTASCQQVHPYCQQCYVSALDRLPKCRKCQKGFYVDFDGYCQACEWQMPYCEECDISTQCKACQITLYLKAFDKTCQWCQKDVGPQCVRCKENGAGVLECQRCRKGFTFNQTHLNKACIPCSNTLAGCKLCSDPNICTTCLPEFYLNATNNQCQSCSQTIPNCARCRPLVTNFQCVQCATNFALQINPSTGATKCGPCSNITTNCNSCVGKDRCTQCLLTSSTYVNTYKNTCNKCQPPCKTCTKKYKCVSCTQPYLMVVDFEKGVCQACWKHVPNCLQCESGANVSVTPRNTIDGATKYRRCLKCKQHCILKQHPVTLGQSCHQCLSTEYAFYDLNDPYGECRSCSNQCKSCSSPTECLSCLDAYAQRKINDKIQCFDRCGDGKVIDFECDLQMGNEKDGCTSQCTVETGFVCDLYYKLSGSNLTDKTDKVGIRQYVDSLTDRNSQEYILSQCSYKGAVQMKLKRIQKEKFENIISVQLSLDPFLHAYKALSAQQLSTLFTVQYQGETLNRTGYNVRLVPKNRSVLLVFPIEKTLTSPLVVTLAHGAVTSIPRKFVYTLDSTLAFRLKDENGLMPFYYSEDEIKLWGSVHTGLQVVSIVGWVAMAVSVILKSTVGVQFLLILQSLYISLTWYQQPLSLQFISLTGLSLSTGYNPASTLDSQHYSSLIVQQSSIPNRLLEYYVNPNSGQYSSLFIEMQFTAFLFVIFYLLSYIAWMFQVSYNPTIVVWARYLNNFFYTDCMLVTAMVQLLPLVNQAFLMGYYWKNVEDFDRFIAGNLLVMGLYSLIVVIVRWFRTPHQKYTKIKPKIQPFNLLMQPFSRYNFPLIKQKFFNLYIWTMLFSATSCVFGSFHPMMPCLFYTFLAFVVEWYKPYQNMFSNHRAFYYCLVIAFGYLIRTFYLFRFNETSLAKDCRWTIPVWMLMMVVAFVLGVVDLVMWLRREAAERRLRQEEFLAKLLEENKLLEKATAEQQNVKQYRSHNPHVQNLLYHDYYQHQIGPQVRLKLTDSQQVADKKLVEAKKKLKPKPIQKNQVQYQSNFNVKRKQGLYDQIDIRDQQTLGNQKWIQLNFWKQSKRKEQQLKQKKKHDLSIAYNAIGLVMQLMDELLKEKGYLNGQLELMRFNLKEKLVNDFREEQYHQGLPYDSQDEQGNKEAKQKAEENAESKQEHKAKILTRKEMTERQLGKYNFVDQVDRHKKEYYREGSFPKVEIHYKKAVKRSESERKPVKKEQDSKRKEQNPGKQLQNPGRKQENPGRKEQNKANFMQALGKSPIQAFFEGEQAPQPVQYNQRLQIVKMKLKMLRKQNKNIS